ncbi:putative ibr domain-containing protein [Diplodia seriata]|uniref:RBR-type E3 ubiquitin transferase n=1 Tax=Diplodia seriata TaxID=420778 RepID=A0A0G2F0J7_9PEZI|nr:putative ibr domain-containing protein [Diplodia seriata]
MDSDDDFNSAQSTEDEFMVDDDSDVSLGDDSDLDVEDADVAFDSQDKDIKPSKKSYEVDFKVYSPGDIQAYQNRVIDEVSQILGQPAESTAILLRYARWNKERLIEQYMDKQEELLEDAGLGDDVAGVVKIAKAGSDFMCDICADDDPDLDTFAMRCGHRFCVPCWKQYLYTKIKDEGEAARIKCPGSDCNRIVDSKSLELLVAEDLKARYHVLLTRTWYNCNRYEEKSGHEARDAQAKSRQSLERYLHYYNRYANHEQSAKLDKDIYLKTERKMMQLQTTSGMSWIEVQFLEQASQALQQCRQTLKWTYAFAYYLARNNLTEIFEDNQKDLEMAVENLSEMFEKPVDQLSDLKVEMMDKTSYCNRRRVILLSDTADNLKSGNWEFNVDLSG